jgi:hypothetical protein
MTLRNASTTYKGLLLRAVRLASFLCCLFGLLAALEGRFAFAALTVLIGFPFCVGLFLLVSVRYLRNSESSR